MFGDLKKYEYKYKFMHLQFNTEFVSQIKATRVSIAVAEKQEKLCDLIKAKF